MKTQAFIIFFTIVFLVYSLANYYIFLRGHQSLQAFPVIRHWFVIIFLILAASYFLGRFLERSPLYNIGEAFSRIGSFWLAAMAYFLILVIFFDIIRLLNHFLHFFPGIITGNMPVTRLVTFACCVLVVTVALFYGYINARNPVLKTVSLNINKAVPGKNSLRLVFVSDIHLGSTIGRERLGKMVETINSRNPDLVILGGDVMDEDLMPVIRRNLGEQLKSITSKYGVLAVTGNHEYIGNAEAAVKYMQEHNIKVLRDTFVVIDGCCVVAGREDRDITRFSGKHRKEITGVLEGADISLPVILVDHQPFNLEKAVEAGVDLQLSGHTHDAQMWPFNYMTDAIYEISHGYLQKGKTQFYVSNGAGTWGPPIRIGNKPEIVEFNITFTP